jgi:hypothetical protein
MEEEGFFKIFTLNRSRNKDWIHFREGSVLYYFFPEAQMCNQICIPCKHYRPGQI